MQWISLDQWLRFPRLQAQLPADSAVDVGSAHVRGVLLRDWAELAGKTVERQVRAQLSAENYKLQADIDAKAWVDLGVYLRLHALLIDVGARGDRAAFVAQWRKGVHSKIPMAGKWLLRAVGLKNGLCKLDAHWPNLCDAPPPHVVWYADGCEVSHFAQLPTHDPTWQLLTALQFEIMGQLLGGDQVRVEIAQDQPFALRLRA